MEGERPGGENPGEPLVERARSGDRAAFEELVRMFEERIRAFIRSRIQPPYRKRLDPAEILQDTLVRALGSVGSFRGARPDEFRRWLTGVANKIVAMRHSKGGSAMKGKVIAVCCGMVLGCAVTLCAVVCLFADLQRAAAQGGGGGTPCGNGDVNADGDIDLTDAVYILESLFMGGPEIVPIEGGPATGGALPASGQTLCYNAAGIPIACDGADYPGQDGFYIAGYPAPGRFVDNGDGTVTDSCTGLMWQKDTAPGTHSWQNALKYCENLTIGEHADWRLPNARELFSIVDYGRLTPSIDPAFSASSVSYWSSTSAADLPTYAWFVDFYVGIGYGDSKGVAKYVRAVRGGQ